MPSLLSVIYVALGGALGSVSRYLLGTWTQDMPIIVEIVDIQDKLEKFLEIIEPHIKAGLVTIEKAQVKFYRFEP